MRSWDTDATKHNFLKQQVLGTLRTPTPEEYKGLKPLRKFIKKLAPTRVKMMPVPTELPPLCEEKNCTVNASIFALTQPERKFDFVFGFRIWMSNDRRLFRGEGHVWLRDADTDEWVDPTPTEDDIDTHILNVESKKFLSPEDRQRVYKSFPLHMSQVAGGSAPFPYKVPSIESCSTRLMAGCVNIDPVFHSTPCLPLHSLEDLCLLEDITLEDMPYEAQMNKSPTQVKLKQRREKKDKEFWKWRQSVIQKWR